MENGIIKEHKLHSIYCMWVLTSIHNSIVAKKLHFYY
jgi:hypothetical protein